MVMLVGILGGQSCEDSNMSLSIHDVKAKYKAQLMAEPGVVSVGIGRDDEGKPVIIVGLDSPRPETMGKLPKELDGYRLRVEVVGPLKAQ